MISVAPATGLLPTGNGAAADMRNDRQELLNLNRLHDEVRRPANLAFLLLVSYRDDERHCRELRKRAQAGDRFTRREKR